MAANVEIATREGRAHFHGLMRCGLVWECPVCQMIVKAERAGEVRQAVEWHTRQVGADGAGMMSLTVRHGMGDDLNAVRKGVARAMQKFSSGAPFRRMAERYGMVGRIRALEVTHGPNGWHPHLHLVFLTRRPLDAEFASWASARWQSVVSRTLGSTFAPSSNHGCVISPCHRADYLQKLGLEIASPTGTKVGRGANKTPLQLLAAAVDDGDADALSLYAWYCDAMKGARMLTWSRGLKVAAAVGERTDEEIVAGQDAPEKLVVAIRGQAWDAIRDMPHVPAALLARAEESALAVRGYLQRITDWPPGFDPLVNREPEELRESGTTDLH